MFKNMFNDLSDYDKETILMIITLLLAFLGMIIEI